MSDAVIRAKGLAKSYVIGHEQATRSENLRDAIAGGVGRWWSRLRNPEFYAHDELEEFWALRDATFEIARGDRVGIVGHNGAGKSTLLKILSRITEPTRGQAEIRGRVASLLEVGTGFHSELSGRENIFLNGAILGMSRQEVRRKFDEIVDFAEVEKFLDTPVKRYSSGMYVRLAFAVAAHLEPEILIVDEVLAVGDAGFQNKCLGRMQQAGDEGRTVLFVSHNMAMVSNLCHRGIVLNGGRVTFQGEVTEAVNRYYKDAGTFDDAGKRFESEVAALLGVDIQRTGGASGLTVHDEVIIRMRYRIKTRLEGVCVPNFHFFTADGHCAFVSHADETPVAEPGEYQAECRVPGGLLNEGTYFVSAALTSHFHTGRYCTEFLNQQALTFTVIDPMDERSHRYNYRGAMPGAVRPTLNWRISRSEP